MKQRAWLRWAPLSGAVFVALMVVGFAIGGDSPDPDDPRAEITRYLADGSKQDQTIAGWFILLAAGLFAVGFFAALRSRLADEEGGLGRLGHLAFGAGLVSVVFLVAGITTFVSPVIAASDAGAAQIDPGLYRITQYLGYMLCVAGVVIAALAVWATSAVVLRTDMLPRWFGWLGIVVGLACLGAFAFFPILAYLLWILLASILLVARPGRLAPQASQPPSAVPI